MIGSLYTLLFVSGSVAPNPPAPPTPQFMGGGWPNRGKARRKREEEDAPDVVAPVDSGVNERVLSLQAAIVRAKNAQARAQRQADEAVAERDALLSKALIAQAVEAQRLAEADYMMAVQAEAVARRQLMDMDIAFVVAVLSDM